MTELRRDADTIVKAAITAALPDAAVKKALEGRMFGPGKVRLVAVGKGAWQMAFTASDILKERIEAGVVVTNGGVEGWEWGFMLCFKIIVSPKFMLINPEC